MIVGKRLFVTTVVSCLVLLISAQTRINAQVTTTATLTGVVTDQSGAVIPGADVVARNTETAVEYKATTNARGEYQLLNLPPGSYTMTAGAKGFKTAATGTFTMTVNQSSTQNFKLTVGQVTQTVEVTGAAPMLQTGNASMGTIIDSRKAADLPLNGRQFTELMLLIPGASPIDQKQDTIPGIGSTTSQLSHSTVIPPVDGRPSRDNIFFVDGIIDTETFFTGFAISPSVDIIQEFNVETDQDQASTGLVSGAVVNVATKSGTNKFHGDLFEFNRNKAVEARNFFDPSNRPNFNQNQFGGTLGGPVPHVHDTWFFGGYEGFRFVQGSSILSRVPTPAERNGDFSAWLTGAPQTGVQGTDALGRPVLAYQVFNPYTGRQTTAGQVDSLTGLVATKTGFVREPFSGNMVPQSLWNPVTAFMRWLPQPNYPQGTAPGFIAEPNFINTQSSRLSEDEFSIRVDHRFGPNDVIYGRYLFNNTTSFAPAALPVDPTVAKRNVRNVGMHWIHTFSPSLVLDLTAGFQQARNPGFVQQPGDKYQLFQDSGYGVPGGAFFWGAGNLMPQYPGTNSGFGGVSASSGSNLDPERIQDYAADITKIVGRHTLKAGAVWFHSHSDAINGCPSIGFGSLQTGDPSNPTHTGLAFASFLLGDPSGGRIYSGDQGTVMDFNIIGFYGQDTFRVTPKLTVNFGLRWDHTTPPVEKHNRLAGFDQDLGEYVIYGTMPPPACNVVGTAPCIPGNGTLPAGVVMAGKRGDTNPTYDNFQPRFGLAYQINNQTVVRVGAGTAFNNFAFWLQNAQDLRGSWPFGLNQTADPNLNQTFFTNDAQHVVSGAGIIPPPTPFPAGSRVNSSKAKNAYVTHWNVDLQRQVTNSLTLDGAYVGSKGMRTYTGFTQNTALYPAYGPIIDRVPFRNLRIGANGGRTIGSSWYNAFQFKANQRLSKGMSALVSFTWDKSEDTGCSGYAGIEGCTMYDIWNINSNKSISGFNVSPMFTVSWLYQLPFGKGNSFFNQGGTISAIAGNWQVNGIFRTFNGEPVTVVAGGDYSNIGNGGATRPDRVLGVSTTPANRSRLQWFNPDAFKEPPDCRLSTTTNCRYGTVGRNTLRGPAFNNLDFSVFRDFPISDRLGRIQFRFEFFNLFNHTNFLMPGFGNQISLSSVPFSEINSAAPSRQIQFGGKWIF